MIRDFLILFGSALVANWAIEKWVLRPTDDSPSGFITVQPGFGMDDLVRPIGIALVALLAHAVIPGK
jgi:hypothetical protein